MWGCGSSRRPAAEDLLEIIMRRSELGLHPHHGEPPAEDSGKLLGDTAGRRGPSWITCCTTPTS
jgi:hypothetical protein